MRHPHQSESEIWNELPTVSQTERLRKTLQISKMRCDDQDFRTAIVMCEGVLDEVGAETEAFELVHIRIDALLGLAHNYRHLGQAREALDALRSVIDVAAEAGLDSVPNFNCMLGHWAEDLDDLPLALQAFEFCLANQSHTQQDEQMNHAMHAASLNFRLGNFERAIELGERIVKGIPLAKDVERKLAAQILITAAYRKLGNFQAALSMGQKTLASARWLDREDHIDRVRRELAMIALSTDPTDDALATVNFALFEAKMAEDLNLDQVLELETLVINALSMLGREEESQAMRDQQQSGLSGLL